MEDRRIVALLFERSEQGLRELMEKYGGAVRKVASNILSDREDVEECVNDTFLRVWETVPPNRPDYPGAYCCRIARYISLDRYHANTAQKRNPAFLTALDELEGGLASSGSVENELDALRLSESINRFLAGLGYDDRYIFTRRYWYADKVSDIAQSTSMSSHAVSVRLFRLRRKLNDYLHKEGLLQ